jgi:peptidoglycan/xylan/chitin deacetylase (PgdA/CDA1 family)
VKIGLRICVNSLQGALQGVPNLLRLFDEYKIRASFFFALGPDRSSRLCRSHALQPWRHSGSLASRLYGTLQPLPLMATQAAEIMRSVDAAGHETGLLSYDPVRWLDKAAFAGEAWTREQVMQAVAAYEQVFQKRPQCHAAAGWQLNPHLLQLEQELDFAYASDVRGQTAFLPQLQGVASACPQIPTTLPVLLALLKAGREVTTENVHEYLYAESQYVLPQGHVYSLDAEMEGITFLPLMEKLVVMWKGYGEGLTTLGALHEAIDMTRLKRHQVGWSQEEGLENYMARQSLPQ